MRKTIHHSSKQTFSVVLRLLVLCSLLSGMHLQAAEDSSEASAIRELLQSTQPGIAIESISLSPLPGMYQVSVQNGQTIHVSADARFLIPGDLYEASNSGLVNLGEEHRQVLRMEKISALDEEDMIIFPARKPRATLTVFTDIDCPYCRKLHGDIDELNELGITVRYLAFPRKGLDEVTYPKMRYTWCAKDPKAMFTAAKRGMEVPEVECDDPVAEQYELGREVGVTGTPALIFEDGSILPGYVPAPTLLKYLFPE